MPAATSPSRPLLWVRRGVLGVIALMLALLIAVATWIWFDDSITFTALQPDAADLLNNVVATSGLPTSDADPIETTDPDGMTPETASRTLRIRQSAAEVTRAVERACRTIRFQPADRDYKASMPETVCVGMWNDRNADVGVALRCKDVCAATIQAHVLAF